MIVRAGFILGAAALVALTGLFPWFRTRTSANEGWKIRTATAWAASSWWTAAIVLCLIAATLGVYGVTRRGPRRTLLWTAAALTAAAIAITGVTWATIPTEASTAGLGWVAVDASTPDIGDIIRDHLVLVHRDGVTQEVGWGLYAGLSAMVILAGILTLQIRRR